MNSFVFVFILNTLAKEESSKGMSTGFFLFVNIVYSFKVLGLVLCLTLS